MQRIEMDKKELQRRTEAKKRKREEYEKLGGTRYENNPNKPKLPHLNISHPPSKLTYTGFSSSGSNFLQNLEKAKKEIEIKAMETKEFLRSRVYTFGKAQNTNPQSVDEKERYSGIEISRRYLSEDELFKIIDDIKVLRLEKLFAKVYPPDFQTPRYPNWCTLGVLFHKSDIQVTAGGLSRFMNLHITDFKLNVMISIFNQELIEKYNKLKIGDLIAVLNPDIYINKKNNSFNLKLTHKYDSILEIGTARNFGFCTNVSRLGNKRCSSYVDKSVDTLCPFHQEQKFSRTASRRMELQSSARITAPVNRSGVRQKAIYNAKTGQTYLVDDESAPKIDRVSKLQHKFSTPEAHQAYFNSNFVNEKALKERRERQEKERAIAKKKKDIMFQRKLERIREKKATNADLVERELQELEELRKSKESEKIDFGPSQHTIDKKRQEQQKTKLLLERIQKKEKERQTQRTVNEETKPFERISTKQIVLQDSDSDSDSSDGSSKRRDSEVFKRFQAKKLAAAPAKTQK